MVHPSRVHAEVMRAVAGALSPFGILAGVLYCFLVVPPLAALLGLWLLASYHRLVKGDPAVNPVLVWTVSLIFNLPGLLLLGEASWWLGLWPLVASALSVSALAREGASRRTPAPLT
jgi:hypothetical protein